MLPTPSLLRVFPLKRLNVRSLISLDLSSALKLFAQSFEAGTKKKSSCDQMKMTVHSKKTQCVGSKTTIRSCSALQNSKILSKLLSSSTHFR